MTRPNAQADAGIWRQRWKKPGMQGNWGVDEAYAGNAGLEGESLSTCEMMLKKEEGLKHMQADGLCSSKMLEMLEIGGEVGGEMGGEGDRKSVV